MITKLNPISNYLNSHLKIRRDKHFHQQKEPECLNPTLNMDEILSKFIKDPSTTSTTTLAKSSNSLGEKRQRNLLSNPTTTQSSLEIFNTELQRLRSSYEHHIQEGIKIEHEIEKLFKQRDIVTGKANLISKEISLLTLKQLRKEQTGYDQKRNLSSTTMAQEYNGGKQDEFQLLSVDNNILFCNDLNGNDDCSDSFDEAELLNGAKRPKKINSDWNGNYESSINGLSKSSSAVSLNTTNGSYNFEYDPNLKLPITEHSSRVLNENEVVTSRSSSLYSTVRNAAYVSKNNDNSGILSLETIHSVRCFNRKARFISFSGSPFLQDLMITGSLDGYIQLWSYKDKKVQNTVLLHNSCKPNFKCFPENIQWNHSQDSVGVVWCGEQPTESYLNVYSDFDIKQGNLSFQSFQIKCSSHTKNVRCITSLPTGLHLPNVSRFVTAGDDKSVICWTVGGEACKEPKIEVLHTNKHTSAIHSLHYATDRRVIVSGGMDCKLVFHSLDSKVIDEYKLLSGERISNIIAKPNDPNTLLVSLCTKEDQLNLFDLREKRIVQRFGWPEKENLSVYASPSWHYSGNYVAFGSVNDSTVNIWDIRNISNQKRFDITKQSSIQTQHSGRILKSIFHPFDDTLVTCSTMDRAVNFIPLKYPK